MLLTVLTLTSTARAQHDTPARFETGLEGRSAGPPRRSERVDFNLEDGDLMDLVRMMTAITGYRFIITASPRALTATVASTELVGRAEAYRAFLAILNLNGLTVVRRGRYHVIVDSQEMSRRPTALSNDEHMPHRDERFVTWIHRLRHMPVSEATQLLEGLRSSEGSLVPYAPTRTLIVIDTGANIHRMRNILRTVDVAQSDAHIWVEPIHFADAADMATSLGAIFGGDSAGSGAPAPARRPARRPGQQAAPSAPVSVQHAPIRFLPDERTNALIIIGTEPEYRRVIELLRELDQRDRESSATVRVRRLENADAEGVAATLTSLLGEAGGASGGSASTETPRVEGMRGAIRVEAHTDLNALLITATPSDHRAIAELIAELDVAPRQVFLEMVLMELTVDDEDSLGLDLLGGIGGLLGGDLVGVLANVASGGASSTLGGLTLGLMGPNLPGTSTRSFGVEMQALAAAQQTNVISTPYVLALDNREAVINVGQNVPLQSSSVAGLPSVITQSLPPEAQQAVSGASALSGLGGGGGGRRDTGTIVTVTPHINEAGQVRLEIQAEDSRQDSRVGNLDASVISQSIAQTELVAQDGQTVVIGGMMRDAIRQTQSGLPVLSQIPILGALFGTQSQRTEKRNLLFFITPHIVRGPRDIRAIFERRMRERREFLQRHMAFRGDWERPIDYSRTRGLVSEMLDLVGEVEADAEAAAIVAPPDPEHTPRAPIGAGDEPEPGDALSP